MTARVFLLFASLAIFPGEARAQTALERIEPSLARAIEQHHALLTCSSGDDRALIEQNWRAMVADARRTLADRYTSLADLAAFDKRTGIEAVKLAPDTPPTRLDAFCNVESAGWYERYFGLLDIMKIGDQPSPAGSR